MSVEAEKAECRGNVRRHRESNARFIAQSNS